MEIIRIPRIMHDTALGHILRSRTIGFVPTMGALHEGHLSLIRIAKQENDIVIASVFVNPTQFGPTEDLATYPNDSDADIKILRAAEVDYAFVPAPQAMYPQGFKTSVRIGGVTERMCGAFRPGHFDGVATVVSKLFNIAWPKRAYFGLKDYQQCQVIKRLAVDLNHPVEIVECPTVREHDGLAMSSRNAYLSDSDRRAASVIHRTLEEAASIVRTADRSAEDVWSAMNSALRAEARVTDIQYAGAFDPETLEPLAGKLQGRTLLAIALKIGTTRLIDNLLV